MTDVQLPMQNGSTGPGVMELQYRFMFLGNWQLAASGTFDHPTYLEVLQFQERQGLEQTGVVDDNLWQLIVADSDLHGYKPADTMSTPVLETDTKLDTQMRIDFNNLAGHLADQTPLMADAIESAVSYFAEHAKARLKEHSTVTPMYGKMLARHIAGELGKAITGAIKELMKSVPGGSVATYAVEAIWIGASMTMERQAGALVEHELSNDQRALEQSVAELATKMHSQLLQGMHDVKKDATGRIQEVVDSINNNDQLDEVTTALANQIYKGGPETFDAVLTTWFNIPGDLEALRRRAYEGLVQGLETFLASLEPKSDPSPRETYYEKNAREFEEEHRTARIVRDAVQGLPNRPGPHQ